MTMRDLAFVDVETSGLDSEVDRVIEICALRTDPKAEIVQRVVHYRINPAPDFEISAEVAELNGYDRALWKETGVAMSFALEAVAGVIEGAKMAGFNPEFDKRFMRAEARRLYMKIDFADYHTLDVSSLFQPLVDAGLIEGVSLRHVNKLLGRPEQTHRADADVRDELEAYRWIRQIQREGLAACGLIDLSKDTGPQ